MFKFLSIDTTFSDIIFLIFIITPTIKSNEIAIRKNPNEINSIWIAIKSYSVSNQRYKLNLPIAIS
jgi:hypothetical protein